MKKTTLTIALLSTLPLSMLAHAGDIRLVVKNSPQTVSKAAKVSSSNTETSLEPKLCVDSLDGVRKICAPNPYLKSKSYSSISKVSAIESETYSNDSGLDSEEGHYAFDVEADSAEQAIETLMSTGLYEYVEEDVPVYTNEPDSFSTGDAESSTTSEQTNDPLQSFQNYIKDIADEYAGVASANFAPYLTTSALSENSEKIGVVVIDSSFHDYGDEIVYTQGSNFTTMDGAVRGDDYLLPLSESSSCGAHGSGVSSVIASTPNNGVAFVGAGGNINLYVAQSLNCGSGMLSDAAAALRWAAKESFSDDGISDVTGDIKVANISLGGVYSTCPTFFQEAIDYAVDRGITVVAAAGNNGIDVSGFAPANCNNVIVVAATNIDGEMSSFSNYGDGVDISTLGYDVAGLKNDTTTVANWYGTSFAAPIVTSAIAHAYRENPDLTPSMAKLALKWSARDNDDAECLAKGCGTGLLDLPSFLEMIDTIDSDEANTLTHALAGETECDQETLVDILGESAQLCDMYQATFIGDLAGDTVYKVMRSSKTGDTTPVVITTTQSGNILLSSTLVDVDNYDYSVSICDDSECSDSSLSFELDTEMAADEYKPAACNL